MQSGDRLTISLLRGEPEFPAEGTRDRALEDAINVAMDEIRTAGALFPYSLHEVYIKGISHLVRIGGTSTELTCCASGYALRAMSEGDQVVVKEVEVGESFPVSIVRWDRHLSDTATQVRLKCPPPEDGIGEWFDEEPSTGPAPTLTDMDTGALLAIAVRVVTELGFTVKFVGGFANRIQSHVRLSFGSVPDDMNPGGWHDPIAARIVDAGWPSGAITVSALPGGDQAPALPSGARKEEFQEYVRRLYR